MSLHHKSQADLRRPHRCVTQTGDANQPQFAGARSALGHRGRAPSRYPHSAAGAARRRPDAYRTPLRLMLLFAEDGGDLWLVGGLGASPRWGCAGIEKLERSGGLVPHVGKRIRRKSPKAHVLELPLRAGTGRARASRRSCRRRDQARFRALRNRRSLAVSRERHDCSVAWLRKATFQRHPTPCPATEFIGARITRFRIRMTTKPKLLRQEEGQLMPGRRKCRSEQIRPPALDQRMSGAAHAQLSVHHCRRRRDRSR